MAKSTSAKIPYRVKDLTGQPFGRFIVLGFVGINKHRQSMWLCQCSCPKKTKMEVSGNSLVSGHTQSCGCLYEETRATSKATHGGCYEPEYVCWRGMMTRCYDPNHISYPAYGGAGVTVQADWHGLGYRKFKKHIGPRPSLLHTIDRFPNKEGNYEEGNVRWATKKEQSRNRKNNRILTFQGKALTQAEWTEIKGWHVSKLKNRKRAGWTDERALSTP